MASEEEIAAREAEIIGAPIRIAPLPQEELGAEVRSLVRRIGETLGIESPETLTTYFAVLARHPDLFRLQLETGIFLFSGSTIPPRERELAVLRTAWLAGAPYEWGQHVLIGRELGISEEDTDRVRAGPEAEGWTGHEAALLHAVDELIDRQMISDATWAALAATWNEAQLIELPCLVGQYFGVAMLQNSLRMPLAREARGFAER
ncbi:carboxymuconolactone decarboxylase family protein [Novosphingobium sp. MW5]|nr:carboxymuconolactone decarboxylase family protein [Novosphingobium sp. MW5]